MSKNRDFSFVHDQNPGVQTAVRVTFAEPPPEYWDDLEGRVLWVGGPAEITEASGSDGPEPPPKFWGATLQCGPFYTDWSVYDRVDVYDDAIIPGSTFELDTILSAPECKVTEEYGFSAPTPISTASEWGDVVGDCGVTPCTVPQGVVDFEDITAVVEKYKNNPDAPIKSRADLINSNVTDPEPDRKVDFTDITFCVDAFRGFEENPNSYPGPNLDDFDCPPYVGDCYADIRVDSNNDGEIDDFDDVVEETSTMFLVVNSDDDDESGEPDFNEAPVVGEDDLAEIQLTAACDDVLPELAWWSLSWEPTEAPIAIWLYPDKSDDGEGGWPGDPIVNSQQYDDWPPPESVWLESLETFDDLEITFTFYPGTGELRILRLGEGEKQDKVSASSQCTPSPIQERRYYVQFRREKPQPFYNGIIGYINTKSQYPLCNETGIPHQTEMGSMVYVDIGKVVVNPPQAPFQIWNQMGYISSYVPGANSVVRTIYMESQYGPKRGTDRFVALVKPHQHLPGDHSYGVYRLSPLAEWQWEFLLDGEVIHKYPHEVWGNTLGESISIAGELINKEDTLAGREGDRCVLHGFYVLENWQLPDELPILEAELGYKPDTPALRQEWGIEWKAQDKFEIWDKKVP